ncbi:hypothetical protein EXE46_07960 [Halorubrum sp. GN11_10-6_MGM]|uniref:DUF7093 family protein n=1 Tax=Halorubrum sp. GN11_10-6_MGM TaxID=2518112 RepID=UPI0010FA1346|nr:hypothetical protein [Halorubrum sp. GN11_10-6_MGM]TKX74628.1 hypothetical protein EXE46_07960 [Halorubrum sp. GN11_10-6_MGM]
MGLRCLLGHDFGEPELQREREEEGDEVVTTVKEVKTCARCGETQVVSENTEVTTMEQLADEAAAKAGGGNDAGTASGTGDAPGAAEETADSGTAPGGVGADDATAAGEGLTLDEDPGAGSDDAVIIDDGSASDEEADTVGAGASPEGGDAAADVGERPDTASAADATDGPDPTDEDAELLDAGGESGSASSPAADDAPESASADETDAESDDGVILDDEERSTEDRERGAWPSVDEADTDADGATAWPDHGGEDEGFSAAVGEGGDAGVEFGGGLTPEAADREAEEDETEYVEAPDDAESVAFESGGEDGTGITRGESPELETIGDDEPTEYYCPECGMVRAADGSSMRAGDICPECKRGYVDERPR